MRPCGCVCHAEIGKLEEDRLANGRSWPALQQAGLRTSGNMRWMNSRFGVPLEDFRSDGLSKSEIVQKYSIGRGLDAFRDSFSSTCAELDFRVPQTQYGNLAIKVRCSNLPEYFF